MPVTSTTLAGVNVWRFAGAVTDAEIKTAWSALIVNNRYKPARAIYIDDTCSLVNVRGTYYVDCENLGIILHLSRNKTNTLFSNWILTQTVGLSVGARANFVRFTNGTTITNSTLDGIDMKGGAMIYAVIGNPGGGDPRFLNEMMFGSLDGTVVTSAAWTEQEIEPTSIGAIWRGLNVQKAAGYPILSNSSGTQRHVIYRSAFNTEGASLRLIRPYYNNSLCYVSSTVRRQGAAVTANLLDTFGSNGSAVIMVLNNFTDESWFGASKTALTGANWNAGNRVIGGVMKKIQVQPSTLIRTYDSRSTTASQKSTFSETTQDFLSGTDSTTSDASIGRAQIVCVGAIATGSGIGITRYSGQRFTLQKFGYQVQVETPNMTFGDDDLSAFAPITMTVQTGISRTQAEINAATVINSFQQLLEELHVLAIGLVGSASYNAFSGGNLFSFSGGVLTTNFASVTVDATAASKISYNSATNSLTIKSTTLASNSTVTAWNNASGTVTLSNGATITGLYTTSSGNSSIIERTVSAGSSVYFGNNDTGVTTLYQSGVSAGAYRIYLAPGVVTPIQFARELYGFQRVEEIITPSGTLDAGTTIDIPDVGITQTTLATVLAYTEIETASKFYDRTAAFRLTEQGIKLGQIATRSGTAIEIGSFSHLINKDAVSVYAVSGSLITTKSTSYAGDNVYTTEIATPPATITANSTEVITIAIEDANGNSQLTINGGDGEFELWKVTTSTPTADYATGTLLDTVGNGIYRFIGVSGFDIVGVDTNSNIRRRTSMAKGVYTQAFYVGDQIQLAQAPEVTEINTKVDILQIALDAVQAKTDNLPDEPAAVGDAMTLTSEYDAAKTAASQASVDALGTPLQAGDVVDANIVKVNDIFVDGVGSKTDPWGPIG